MLRRSFLASVLAATLALPAIAHSPKGNKVTGPNGGESIDVDGGHLEMIVTPSELRIFVTDVKDEPLSSAGLTARAIVQTGSKQDVLPLTPKEPNLLVTELKAPLGKGAKVAVSTNLAKGGKPMQARFVVK